MIKIIKIPIYYGHLVIIQENDLNKIPAFYKPKDLMGDSYGGYFHHAINDDGVSYFIIRLKDSNCDPECISHEAFHCMNDILKHRGVGYSHSNHEHAAYLLGWIVGQCFKYMNVKTVFKSVK